MVPRVIRSFLIAGALALACLAAPSVAAAAVTVDSYKITSNMPAFPTVPSDGPSTFQAGANPDAGSWSVFSYPNSSEDVKTAITNVAPGLLGNPESVPKCPQAALEAGGAACPAGSAIGTSRLDIIIAATGAPPPGGSGLPSSLLGTLYNAEPLGNEPGRLAAVTPTGGAPLVSSIPFEITPRGGGDYGLTGTLTDINRLPANAFGPGSPNLQVKALGFVINASTKYVRNPTSCRFNVSTGQAAGYDDPTFVDGPAYGFPTTGCDQVPFKPVNTLELGDRGNTGEQRYPPFKLTIRQGLGEADQLGNKITLPIELNTNNPAYKTCTQAQADADNCPDNSKFGGVAAKSPFLAEELRGPVYLIQQTNTSLPGLLLDLRGRVHVKIQTKTTLVNNRAIQSLVLNAPQLPVSELRIGLNGGRNTGVFLNRQDLCFRGNSTTRFNDVSGLIKDYGHNGTTTAETKLKAKVNGCGPAVGGRISGATSSRPSVLIDADKHPDSPNFKELLVTLSRNLSLVRSRFGRASATDGDLEYVSRRSFRVKGFAAAGETDVAVRLRRGAVRVSQRSRDLLRRGRTRTFRAKVRQTPVSGDATSTQGSFRARGRR
jgi:hypothetical protein